MHTKKPFRRKITRREFLAAGTGVVAGAVLTHHLPEFLLSPFQKFQPKIPGAILGAASKTGHLLRGHDFPKPSEFLQTDFLMVGGGMAGLSSAWWLQKKGHSDFLLLELDETVGGNSRSGKNEVSAYPWGAHYVPIPSPDSKRVIELFEELGVITGRDSKGMPIYEESFLSNDPQERIFAAGKWQEGLIPKSLLSESDHRQFSEFYARMGFFRNGRGTDGKKLFSIPIDESSSSPETRALDRISMTDFLHQQKWDSPVLHWYVNYCCRDDYGAEASQVSAWAGIHYFSSRDGKGANTEKGNVITWPEGNGWLVHQLEKKLSKHIRSNALVFHLENTSTGVKAHYFDVNRNITIEVSAKAAIFSGPRFVAHHVIAKTEAAKESQWRSIVPHLQYSPWMVANITVQSMPSDHHGEANLSWDNVIYQSQSLGYVNACNQSIRRYPGSTVLTYYWPLSHIDPANARKEALAKTHEEWIHSILKDLELAHADLRKQIKHLDVWIWGHGMIRPTLGFMWGEERKKLHSPDGNIFFAHTDMSGISIFEEAQYRGIEAATQAIARVKKI